ILTEPKNCLTSQYKKLFELDQVLLEFTPAALDAIAEKTIERKTGARGLRSILEGVLTKLMFEVPGDHTIEKVTITEETVLNGEAPELQRNPERIPVKIKMTQPKRRARKDSVS
ncbi:MAG: ATP-dependent Clp protease ATP-binding subunit ClpX, partial [Clostridia bacterium]|nr:ATP-dependent Clp protease ATP-binding subunit ClpX [Clostridia bacterium]